MATAVMNRTTYESSSSSNKYQSHQRQSASRTNQSVTPYRQTKAAHVNQHMLFAEYAASNWFVIVNQNQSYTRKTLVTDIVSCLDVLDRFLDYWTMQQFFVPMLIYVDRYINQVGKLGPVHIFDILFASTVITIKTWADKYIGNSTFCKMFSMQLHELNVNELNFLTAIDYNLSCDKREVTKFVSHLGKRRE
eukprot:TRINITY_DN8592_c0_g1_i1.p1 TRINITY_DN8592_c0_g1~~TRINITY_DN8592_c0_g1_i1.p1  ORF type:complete len:192 (-),score=13.60 TRINITY_DN8592_c0_g1_i1:95-670(-)